MSQMEKIGRVGTGVKTWIASIWSILIFVAITIALVSILEGRAEHVPKNGGWPASQINLWILVLLLSFCIAALGVFFVRKAAGQLALAATIILAVLVMLAMMLPQPNGWLFVLGFLFNVGVIWSFLAVRSVVRRKRLEVVVYLADFLLDAEDDEGHPMESASLRLALEKYLLESEDADRPWKEVEEQLRLRQTHKTTMRALNIGDVKRIVEEEKLRFEEGAALLKRAYSLISTSHNFVPSMRSFFSWLPSYLPFVLLAALFFAQFAPASRQLFASVALCNNCTAVAPWGAFWRLGDADIAQMPAALIVATFAFAGAYLHALTDFIRGVVSYDLGPTSFLRAFRHAVTAIVVAVVTWYGLQSVQFQFTPVSAFTQQDAQQEATEEQAAAARAAAAAAEDRSEVAATPMAFLILAFVIGLFPDLGIAELIRRARVQGLKRRGERLIEQVESTPLEVLDGVDYSIRLRLEEFGIVDVQNLATANPILLFAETPMFGLYQSIDWIAQAQLCLSVGPDTFIKLRDWRIRTIFDLERALHDPQTPPYIKTAIGAALLEGSTQMARVAQELHLTGDNPKVEAAEAIGRIIMDDLHVRRLRQIWMIVRDRLGRKWSETLYPAPPPPPPPVAS